GGQVPPELVLLPEQQRELTPVAVIPFPGHITQHASRATGGIKQTGQHFKRSGLPGAIWAEEPNQFTGLDAEAYLLDGEGLLILPAKQSPDRARKACLFFVSAKGLRKAADFDGRHGK